ncbi:Zinc finger SWIM-type [Gracilaria domingensis]|nr:Zinc finger SWIM-type [Gracilaria domingensis]
MSPASSRFRSIRDCQLPLPPEILAYLIAEYTSYCLTKFKEISVVPSKNYVVSAACVLPISGVGWPELSADDEANIKSVAMFKITWSIHLLRKFDSPPPQERRTLTVLFARKDVESEELGDSELMVYCDCRKTGSMGFPCRHIVRCAMVYGEISQQHPSLKDVLDDYIEIESFFDDYWKADSQEFGYLRVCSLRKEAKVLDLIELTEQMKSGLCSTIEQSDGNDVDSFLKQSAEQEVGSCVKWSDSYALFEQIKRVTSGMGPYAVDHFQNVLRISMESYDNGRLPSLSFFNQFKVGESSNPQNEMLRWEQSSRNVIQAPNRANVRPSKRKKSYTERFASKKGKIASKDDYTVDKDTGSINVSQGSQSRDGTDAPVSRLAITAAISKALDIIEQRN